MLAKPKDTSQKSLDNLGILFWVQLDLAVSSAHKAQSRQLAAFDVNAVAVPVPSPLPLPRVMFVVFYPTNGGGDPPPVFPRLGVGGGRVAPPSLPEARSGGRAGWLPQFARG